MRVFAAAVFALGVTILPGPRTAKACTCATGGPLCNADFSSYDPEKTLVFVGRVLDVRSDFNQLVEANLPEELDQRSIRLPPQGTTPTGEYRLLLEAHARAYLTIWGDLLDATEKERIRSIEDPDQVLILGMAATRVELAVEEPFVGEPGDRVIVGTGVGNGDCGIPFEQGAVYVVVATKGRGGLYYTGTCNQTAPVDYQPQTLAALRAWKRGEEFPRTVFGTVRDLTDRDIGDDNRYGPLVGQSIRLVGESQTYQAVADEKGYFEWSDLPAGQYELRVERSGWKVTSGGDVDLRKNRCVEKFVTLEENGKPD